MAAVGSPEFNAPEINYGKSHFGPSELKKAEVFSLGCALFLMVNNPFPNFIVIGRQFSSVQLRLFTRPLLQTAMRAKR